MPLKATVSDINSVPEAIRGEYTKVGEQYVLQVDEKDYKTKIDEFRNNNIALTNEQKELKASLEKFKDIDPAKYAQYKEELSKIEKLEDAQLLKEGKIDDLRKKWTQGVVSDWEAKYNAQGKNLQSLQESQNATLRELHDLLIDTQVTRTINELGSPRPGAMVDILNRARSLFTVDKERRIVPRNPEELQNEKGEPLDLKGWGNKLLLDAEYLFESGGGGGAGGGGKSQAEKTGVTYVDNTPENHGRYADGIAKGTVRFRPQGR